jgi:hypothetical protein
LFIDNKSFLDGRKVDIYKLDDTRQLDDEKPYWLAKTPVERLAAT